VSGIKISWNPLRCGGTGLPVNVVVMWKVMAISLLLTRPFSLRLTIVAVLLGIAASSFRGNWSSFAIWTRLLVFTVLLYYFGTRFAPYFLAAAASMIALARWPRSPMLVIFDGDCAFCSLSKSWIERFDLEGILQWRPYQSGIGETYGITEEEASQRIYLIQADKVYSGFSALKMMALCNPISYLATFTPLALSPWHRQKVAIAVLLFLFSSLFQPIGDGLYGLVARHRRSLVANSHCKIG